MNSQIKVAVLTHLTSPYQVELFNAVHASGDCQLAAIYLHSKHPIHGWRTSEINHPHVIVNDDRSRFPDAQSVLLNSDVAVFNYYQHPLAGELLNARWKSGKPFAFWGERFGATRMSWAGSLYRKWKLRAVHASPAPMWGKGNFAVERYQQEFGLRRQYVNLPYFSDLARFQQIERGRVQSQRTFLFSGALIHRKGVDLLASAFSRLASELPNVALKVLGDGEMRSQLQSKLAGLGPRVSFLGFRDWSALPEVYGDANILCVPSRYDGWALVVPEGLAAGLPVIGTDRTGAALEFIKHRENGWLIPAGNGEALYQAMNEAAHLSDSTLLEFSRAARTAVANHTLENGAQRFLKAAFDAIAAFGPPVGVQGRKEASPILS